MKRLFILLFVLAATLLLALPLFAEDDPFAAGEDALAVNASDGSSSLRAKLELKKMEDDMILVAVEGVEDKTFPECVVRAKVIKVAAKKDTFFKLIGLNKTYRFVPVLKYKEAPKVKVKKGKAVAAPETKELDLTDDVTQNNLGACYYPPKSKLVLRITDVDLTAKVFKAGAVYLK